MAPKDILLESISDHAYLPCLPAICNSRTQSGAIALLVFLFPTTTVSNPPSRSALLAPINPAASCEPTTSPHCSLRFDMLHTKSHTQSRTQRRSDRQLWQTITVSSCRNGCRCHTRPRSSNVGGLACAKGMGKARGSCPAALLPVCFILRGVQMCYWTISRREVVCNG
jgi:hypothetical protein